MKRKLSIFFALIAIISLLTVSIISCGDGGGSGDLFVITSPYEGVNWAWHHHRAAQHVHTTNSDGNGSMEQILKLHYDLDYDIIGITDHVWKNPVGQRRYLDLVTKCVTQTEWTTTNHDIAASVGQELTTALTSVTQERLDQFQSPTRVVTPTERTNTRPLLVIPGSAEFALQPGEDEMNVFFFTGNAPVAWQRSMRQAIEIVQEAGGITFLNHPGRFTRGMDFIVGTPSSPANPSNDINHINRYADIFMDFPAATLVGMEVFNRRDVDSRQDRVLWDNVNAVTIPQGRFVWGYGNDDLHSTSTSATGNGAHINYNVFLMPDTNMENLETNLRNAMVNGHSYIVTVAAFNEGINVNATTTAASARPFIQSITTDVDSITINAGNAARIVWISDGRRIHTTQGPLFRSGLAAFNSEIGSFVRANIIGPGGMAVIQPIRTARVGGDGNQPPETPPVSGFSGTWEWVEFDDESDNGLSTIDSLVVSGGVVTVTGALRPSSNWQYPYAGWEAIPNEETLTNLQAAQTIAFRVQGTPGDFKIKLITSDVTGDAYFERIFVVANTERTITVNIDDFRQPGWAGSHKLPNDIINRANITGIQWQTPDGSNFPFEITMKDLVLVPPAN
jgi:hypothetical protein